MELTPDLRSQVSAAVKTGEDFSRFLQHILITSEGKASRLSLSEDAKGALLEARIKQCSTPNATEQDPIPTSLEQLQHPEHIQIALDGLLHGLCTDALVHARANHIVRSFLSQAS